MKRKAKAKKNATFIIGLIVSIGIFSGAIVTIAGYITLPKRVEAVEKKADKIEDYITEQRIQNEIMQKILEKKKDPIISKNGRWWWDENLGKWRPIRELRGR